MQPGYPPGPPGYPPGSPGYPPGQPGYPPGPQGPPGYPPPQQGYPPQGPPQGAQQSWQWKYLAATFSATLAGGMLTIKQGIRTFNIEIGKLLYLYVTHTTAGSMGKVDTVMLCHQPTPGKKKVVRLLSNANDPNMQALIGTLLSARPDIDIRHLDSKTAHKTMGARRTELIALPIAFFAVMAVMGLLLLPMGLHGIDTGQERVPVAKLYQGYEPSTHNVIVSGKADLDDAMYEKRTHKGRTTVEYYLPLVPPGWKKTDPVHVVLKTGDLGPAAQEQLIHSKQFEGVVDDILWEGLSGSVSDYFTGHMGLKLADDVKVIHYQEDSQMDLFIFVGVMGFTFVIMLVVFGIVLLKRRKNA